MACVYLYTADKYLKTYLMMKLRWLQEKYYYDVLKIIIKTKTKYLYNRKLYGQMWCHFYK